MRDFVTRRTFALQPASQKAAAISGAAAQIAVSL